MPRVEGPARFLLLRCAAEIGLEDGAALDADPAYRGDHVSYLPIRAPRSDRVVALSRICSGCDVTGFDTMGERARRILADREAVFDVGVYVPREAGYERHFLAAWRLTVSTAMGAGARFLYGQTAPSNLAWVRRLGFQRCSRRFRAPGWSGEWCAVALSLEKLLAHPRFRSARALAGIRRERRVR